MNKVLSWKRGAMFVLALLVAVVTISCGSGKKETVAVYRDGELQKEYDINARGWEPGEDFAVLALENGAYLYPWQGEHRIDYEENKGILTVNKKVVGVDLRGVKVEELDDPSIIVTAKVDGENIAELKKLPNLIAVYLIDATNSDLAELAELTNLKALDLWKCSYEYTPVGLRHIKVLKDLRWLRLGDVDVMVLNPASLKELTNLRYLSLEDNMIFAEGFAHLAGLTNLRTLDLENTYIKDDGFAHLKGLINLRILYLGGNLIEDQGLMYLSGLDSLRILDLSSNKIKDDGMEHIAGLANLRELNLRFVDVTDFGLEHLATLQNLKKLNLRDTDVSENGIADLKKSLPKCEILY